MTQLQEANYEHRSQSPTSKPTEGRGLQQKALWVKQKLSELPCVDQGRSLAQFSVKANSDQLNVATPTNPSQPGYCV